MTPRGAGGSDFTVRHSSGTIQVVHKGRRIFYARNGKGLGFMDEAHKNFQKSNFKASLYLKIDSDGELLGYVLIGPTDSSSDKLN